MDQVKKKSKIITLKGEDAFIKLLATQFGITADAEIKLIKVLIKLDLFVPFALDKYLRMRLQKEMQVPYSTLSSSLSRLIKSGVIARNGKNVYVNVAFRGLDEIESVVFKRG